MQSNWINMKRICLVIHAQSIGTDVGVINCHSDLYIAACN